MRTCWSTSTCQCLATSDTGCRGTSSPFTFDAIQGVAARHRFIGRSGLHLGVTRWIYYPRLGAQTLYTAVNDFIDLKLTQISGDSAPLRNKGAARTPREEEVFEELQSFALELSDFRHTLLAIAQHYRPDRNDGVQISAAPLWPLFRHKPWQKVLKDTWTKLERGDYDWSRLAMNYWPDRVRDKCKTDKSLALAHGFEELFVEPMARSKKTKKVPKK